MNGASRRGAQPAWALLACLCATAAAVAAAAPAAGAVAAGAGLPPDSIYQLEGVYTDQAGRRFTLAARRGGPQLLAMFYAGCRQVCPLLIESTLVLERALAPAERARLRVLLVSLDPEHDTPAQLARLAADHHVDSMRWTLARTDPATVRQLAAVLDVRYRRLADGGFDHTSALLLLDGDGRVIARGDSIGAQPDPQLLAAVRAALAASR